MQRVSLLHASAREVVEEAPLELALVLKDPLAHAGRGSVHPLLPQTGLLHQTAVDCLLPLCKTLGVKLVSLQPSLLTLEANEATGSCDIHI